MVKFIRCLKQQLFFTRCIFYLFFNIIYTHSKRSRMRNYNYSYTVARIKYESGETICIYCFFFFFTFPFCAFTVDWHSGTLKQRIHFVCVWGEGEFNILSIVCAHSWPCSKIGGWVQLSVEDIVRIPGRLSKPMWSNVCPVFASM